MSVPFENCPNCLCSQPVSAERCGMCGELLTCAFSLGYRVRMAIMRNRHILFAVAVSALIYVAMLPAPYSPLYWAKRVIFTPSAECVDGIYSFSGYRGGTCSNHGGVRRWIAK